MEIILETNTYLTFRLGDEQFGLNASQVLSILEMQRITVIPNAPEYLKGMINLRGEVLPVVDSRIKFGMQATEETSTTCIIVLNILKDNQAIKVGALVDEVSEVRNISSEQIQEVPSIGTKYHGNYLNGMVQNDDGFIMLLNADSIYAIDNIVISE